MEAWERIIVALDINKPDEANKLAEELMDRVGAFKLGFEFTYSTFGKLAYEKWPRALSILSQTQMLLKRIKGLVFVDSKFNDIPNTVAKAASAVTEMGVKMFNVHCLGGREMMTEARKAAEKTSKKLGFGKPLILGVTILTSLGYEDLVKMGIKQSHSYRNKKEKEEAEQYQMRYLVKDLALLAQECGLDGVICSPKEIKIVREWCQPEFLVVTPGIRPTWAVSGDQKRITTPKEAIKNGADYLVIGRPITDPPDEIRELGGTMKAVELITHEIEEGLEERKKK